jgi:hypothetical protein
MMLSTLERQNSATIINLSVKYCRLVEPAWLASAEFRMYFVNISEEPRVPGKVPVGQGGDHGS